MSGRQGKEAVRGVEDIQKVKNLEPIREPNNESTPLGDSSIRGGLAELTLCEDAHADVLETARRRPMVSRGRRRAFLTKNLLSSLSPMKSLLSSASVCAVTRRGTKRTCQWRCLDSRGTRRRSNVRECRLKAPYHWKEQCRGGREMSACWQLRLEARREKLRHSHGIEEN